MASPCNVPSAAKAGQIMISWKNQFFPLTIKTHIRQCGAGLPEMGKTGFQQAWAVREPPSPWPICASAGAASSNCNWSPLRPKPPSRGQLVVTEPHFDFSFAPGPPCGPVETRKFDPAIAGHRLFRDMAIAHLEVDGACRSVSSGGTPVRPSVSASH